MSEIGQALLSHLSLIGDLTEEDRKAIIAIDGEVRQVNRHEDILRQGDHPTTSVIVLSGVLQRYTDVADGSRQIHEFYFPPDAPCLETLYLDYMDNNLGAVVKSRVGIIPHSVLYALIDQRPEVRKLLWRQTLIQAAMFREWLMRNSTKPARANMAHFFCEMFTRSKAAGLTRDYSFNLPLTQDSLANALGMTPVHTNRTIRHLRDTGLIEWRSGRATILDWDRLSEAAGFDPAYLHLRR